MPRPKVHPSQRRRVARACDVCKRRKEKCDGNNPCDHCTKRRKADGCCYTIPQVNTPAPSTSPGSGPFLQESPSEHRDSYREIDHLLDQSVEDYAPKRRRLNELPAGASIATPIPKLSRMLRDDKGRFMFLGDSASSSFLQTIRRTVLDVVGPCDFVNDKQRHNMFENSMSHTQQQEEPQIELEDAVSLIEGYFLAVSGQFDLFDHSWLAGLLPSWIADPERNKQYHSPVIYLALAIGAQGKARTEADDQKGESLFQFGRQLSVTHLMDDPSIVTVQAFTLITYYLLAACRRNAAFVNLGVAIRAAYSLGIHRHEANVAFVREEGISRERAWKTIRVADLYLSSAMGRPLATSETDCNIPYLDLEVATDRENATVEAQATSAIFRICHVFERILVEIYSKRAVSLELAESISQQHREWAANRSAMLRIDGLEKHETSEISALIHKTGVNHVTNAYYYSIMLLTRPFLSYIICSCPNDVGISNRPSSESSCRAYAAACIDSAIKAIELCAPMAHDQRMPARQPLVVNSLFISGLCLGFAYFGNYDRYGWPLQRWLEIAINALQRLAPRCQQARRCEQICRLLRDAVNLYIKKRDIILLQSSGQIVKSIFGDINALGPQSVEKPFQLPSLETNRRNTILQDSMITTSGVLAEEQEPPFNSQMPQFDIMENLEAMPFDDDLNFLPVNEEVPLFFLTDHEPAEDYGIGNAEYGG